MSYAADSIPEMPEAFSGENFLSNMEKSHPPGYGEHCALCGKWISESSKTVHVSVGDGGRVFLSPSEAEAQKDQNDFMGAFPVGVDCWRRHKRAFEKLGYVAPSRKRAAKVRAKEVING